MISASLNVEGYQIHPEAVVLCLEKVIGQLICENIVELLTRLSGQANKEPVQASWNINQLGVEECL